MVQTIPFGDLQVPSPGFGAMGISFGLGNNLTLEQAEPVLLKAIELGCTFWDTAVTRICVVCFTTKLLILIIIGCVPGWCKREAFGRFHSKA
jgi:hypothetical protein